MNMESENKLWLGRYDQRWIMYTRPTPIKEKQIKEYSFKGGMDDRSS
jgi:hypothetical protein